MSVFADDCAAIDSLHTGFFGETTAFTPRAGKPGDPDARAVADPVRQPVTCMAIWDSTPTDTYPHAREEKDASARKISAGKIVVTVAKADLPWKPLQNDLVLRTGTGESYKIADPAEDGLSDWILTFSARRG